MIVNLNAAPLLLITVLKWHAPASFALWRRQPQPHQVSSRRRRWIVFVGGAGMEDGQVAEELDIPDLEDHMQGFSRANRFEDSGGFVLSGGQGGDDACYLVRLCGVGWSVG